MRACKKKKIEAHPARMPIGLANFFIQFLTDPGDLVLDPFAGSNTTGYAAETLGRHWQAIDIKGDYAEQSKLRFSSCPPQRVTTEPVGVNRGKGACNNSDEASHPNLQFSE